MRIIRLLIDILLILKLLASRVLVVTEHILSSAQRNYRPLTKLQERNVSTGACYSVCVGGGRGGGVGNITYIRR